jgi:hypothetical protein
MRLITSLKCVRAAVLSAALIAPALADDKAGPGAGATKAPPAEDQPNTDGSSAPASAAPAAKKSSEAEMMAMMTEMAKVGDNHKLLARAVGTWSYKVRYWMSPDAPPSESTGTAVAREAMGGRYVITDHTGKMQMPGPDGKMQDFEYKGMAVEGYDNAKKKFVSSWIDNMSTGIMNSEGTYDAGAKTFTYHSEYEMMPGMKTKIRETVKITDANHHSFEFFEDRGGKEVKTMEIQYTRKD